MGVAYASSDEINYIMLIYSFGLHETIIFAKRYAPTKKC